MLNILIDIAMALSFTVFFVGFMLLLMYVVISFSGTIANNEDRKKTERFCKTARNTGILLLGSGTFAIGRSGWLGSQVGERSFIK